MIRDTLHTVFATRLSLPDDACEYLLAVWDLSQGMDDWVDCTEAPLEDKYRVVWTATCGLPGSPFRMRHAPYLDPLMLNVVMKWRAAENVERQKIESLYPLSFVWRAGYYDLVLQVVMLVHGAEAAASVAHEVLGIYGEKLEDYMKEFSHV